MAAAVAFIAALLVVFWPVLAGGRQFGFRDAAHFYYPLQLRIQQEWAAGRWPLWLPEMNGGMPLLGNPTTAVLYPGKLVYGALPYEWAARVYPILHVVVAFGSMLVLLRCWGVSAVGMALGALAFALSGPVVFSCSNVVYLVGAAWLPLGLAAADATLRQGRRWGDLGLALVLSLLLLGGDWEAAYLLVVAALLLATLSRWDEMPRWRRWGTGALVSLAYLVRLALDSRAAGWSGLVGPVFWLGVLVLVVPRSGALVPRLARLAGAIVLAVGLAGVQVGPGLEFAWRSDRAEGTVQDRYRFSLHPTDLIGACWPNVTGTYDQGNHGWLMALRGDASESFWVPSVYAGMLTWVVAIGAFGSTGVVRPHPPAASPGSSATGETHGSERLPVRLAAALVLLGVVAALGSATSPLATGRWLGLVPSVIGLSDPAGTDGVRGDGFPRDYVGSLYWFLSILLPGFGSFRYPAKLLTLATLGLSSLAGLGWDRVQAGVVRSPRRAALGVMVASLLALGGLGTAWSTWQRFLTTRAGNLPTHLGRLDVDGALVDIGLALLHGLVVAGMVWLLVRRSSPLGRGTGLVAILVLATDLSWASRRLTLTVPQEVFEASPRLVAALSAAEREDPSAGPFRIERLALRYPSATRPGHVDRLAEVARWERDTLLFQHPIAFGIESTYVISSAQDWRHALAFAPVVTPVDEATAQASGLRPGEPVVDHPRVSYDAWNTRYFVLPDRPAPGDALRGLGAFFEATTAVAAIAADDVRLLRNERAFPRAWIVHRTRTLPLDRGDPNRARQARRAALTGPDLRSLALVEAEDHARLDGALKPPAPDAVESVVVTSHRPRRVELTARLDATGLVVLAETAAPGWHLTIDGQPAPIETVNLAMRGAVVARGTHRLVYTYDPLSFRVGLAATASSWLALIAIGLGRALKAAIRRSRSS